MVTALTLDKPDTEEQRPNKFGGGQIDPYKIFTLYG